MRNKNTTITQKSARTFRPRTGNRPYFSVAQTQSLDERPVTVEILVLEIPKQSAAFADHFQKAATGMEVLSVDLQMLCELSDALRQHRHLDLGRPCIARVYPVFRDNSLFLFSLQHVLSPHE